MIINLFNQTSDIINILNEAPFSFYLTGSRYFVQYNSTPKISSNTDYDYFVLYNKDVLEYLTSLDFTYVAANDYDKQYEIILKKEATEYSLYSDDNIVGVCFSPCKKVDVQLVKNLDLKIEVQQILACMGNHYTNLDKSSQKYLWDEQYKRICKERNIKL